MGGRSFVVPASGGDIVSGGDARSRAAALSLPAVGCREGASEASAGVGEPGAICDAAEEDLSVPCLVEASAGGGNDCITSSNALLVLRAADWIMGTWCDRLGRITEMSRGVKGTMTSSTMLRNSVSHLRAVDC